MMYFLSGLFGVATFALAYHWYGIELVIILLLLSIMTAAERRIFHENH